MRPSVMWSAVIAAALAVLSVAVALPQVAGLEKTAAADTTSCQQHEYTAYRDCVHATRYKRQLLDAKHHTPTATTNSSSPPTVHCQRLNWDCRIACANNSKCESLCPVCPLNMAQLSADDLRTVVIESADGQHERFQARIEAGRNITTIIRLTNILNNTNHIHIPTNVTTNNVNNVNLHTNHTQDSTGTAGGEFGLGANVNGSCCYVVQPRQCHQSSVGQRCQNRRQRHCDDRICKARVMHAQLRKRCNSAGTECRRQVVYVPDPGAQKCVRTQSWPFIACGPVVASRSGEEAFREQERAYRRGIVPPPPMPGYYQAPYYYQAPPPWMDCRYTPHACYGAGGAGGGDTYGWGAGAAPSRHHQQQHHSNGGDVYYEDEVEKEEGATSDSTVAGAGADAGTGNSGEWLVEDTKCKVVSENGTGFEIKNCTTDGLAENEYAAEPKVNLASDLDETAELDDDVRPKRYAAFASDDGEADELAQLRKQRRRNHTRRQHLETNTVAGADDFEYYEEFEYPPYRRPTHRRRHRRNHRRHGKKHHRKIIYDEE